jgi:hypothetical protein
MIIAEFSIASAAYDWHASLGDLGDEARRKKADVGQIAAEKKATYFGRWRDDL